MGSKELNDAIAASVEASTADTATDAAEGTVSTETPAADAAKTPGSQEVSSEVAAPDIEAFKAAWGVDLSALPDAAAQAKFVAEWTETQKTIAKLQREKAEAVKAAEAAAPAAVPDAEETVDVSKLSDEQLAEALGINWADADERDRREIAYSRTILEQDQRMKRLEDSFQSTTTQTTWDKALDALETQFGKLVEGQSREDLFAWAQENNVANPEAAYWAAQGPVRSAVAAQLQDRIVELRTDGKKAATTPRPKTTAAVETGALESKTIKSAIKEAFEKAQTTLGVQLAEHDD